MPPLSGRGQQLTGSLRTCQPERGSAESKRHNNNANTSFCSTKVTIIYCKGIGHVTLRGQYPAFKTSGQQLIGRLAPLLFLLVVRIGCEPVKGQSKV